MTAIGSVRSYEPGFDNYYRRSVVLSSVGSMTIRTVEPDDTPALVEIARSMHAESVYSFISFDEEKVRDNFAYGMSRDSYFGAVAEHKGQIIGMFLGHTTEYMFSREKLACDILFYVDPTMRGTFAGVKLIHAFVQWSHRVGARECCLGVSAMYDNSKNYKLLEKLGFSPMGGVFKMKCGG